MKKLMFFIVTLLVSTMSFISCEADNTKKPEIKSSQVSESKTFFIIYKSKHSFGKTVAMLEKSAKKKGWKVPKVFNIQKSLKKVSKGKMTKLKVISICKPAHAYKILKNPANRHVSAMMPCRIGVFETKDGVFISVLNSALIGNKMGDVIATTMAKVGKETKSMAAELGDIVPNMGGAVPSNFDPKMLVLVSKSKYKFKKTVKLILKEAKKKGWKIPKVFNIQKSLKKISKGKMTALKVIAICRPKHAYGMLKHEENRMVSAVMPCLIGVYKNKNGVYITVMNSPALGKMFGGNVSKIMEKVGKETKKIISKVAEK
ncbi:MAG: DUF302 domain-containing protein [Spirochaetota bacterium]|nr:DUF302 domain-containing protein [Spirochaetota bacterium]